MPPPWARRRAVTLLKLDATRLASPPATANAPGIVAFLDPPYESALATAALHILAVRHWLVAGAIAVVEVAAREPLRLPPEYALLDERVYGVARLVFARLADSAAAATSAASAGRG